MSNFDDEEEIEIEIDMDDEELELELEMDEDEIELELDFELDEEVLSKESGYADSIDFGSIPELELNLDAYEGFDDVVDKLHSSASIINPGDNLALGMEETLFIDMEDIGELDLDPEQLGKPKYEIALTPAQNAVAIYKPRTDESFELESRNKEIHNIINDIDQYQRFAGKRLREYLDSPKFDFFTKSRFKSAGNKGEQDFRSLMISQFHKLRSAPDAYTEDRVVERVVVAYESELYPELSRPQLDQMISLVKEFLLFADSTFDEAQRQTDLAVYKEFPKKVVCPEVIGNRSYVCKCGGEYEMPEGRPTLTFLLRQVTGTVNVRLMNSPIPCPTCEVYLAIPTALADQLELSMLDFVQPIKATYEHPRIYRPKISDLENMIPSDVSDLFQLSTSTIVESNVVVSNSSSSLTSYKKLINMWMNTVMSTDKLEKALDSIKDKVYLAPVANQVTRVDLGFVPEVYSQQFLKTILHYLEGDSLFAITYDKKAFYEFCERDGYLTKPFPVDFAVKWMKDNAPYLASLNNLYNGDMTSSNISILPEYVEVLNYILSLHILANPTLLKDGSLLGKWYKNPAGDKKKLLTYYEKENVHSKKQIAGSHRDLRNSNTVIDPLCWKDSYFFFKNIALAKRFEVNLSPELNALIVGTRGKTIEEFYGQEMPENTIVRPVFHFEEFMEAMEIFGHYLFDGVIVDQVRKNLAIGIENLTELGLLYENFKSHEMPVTDISDIMVNPNNKDVKYQDLLFAKILSSAELPQDLSAERDKNGYEFLVTNYDEYRDILEAEPEFMRKFGDVVSCY